VIKETEAQDVYSIRKSGVEVARSTIPNCGYTPETLRAMKQEGYYLYKNGKKVK
jgi:hypothetical protein